MANKELPAIKDLSLNQQVALWVILRLDKKAFYSSDIASSDVFTDEGKKAMGGILSSLYRNGFIEKVSGGRDKLWRLSDTAESNKVVLREKLFKVKTYWPESKAKS